MARTGGQGASGPSLLLRDSAATHAHSVVTPALHRNVPLLCPAHSPLVRGDRDSGCGVTPAVCPISSFAFPALWLIACSHVAKSSSAPAVPWPGPDSRVGLLFSSRLLLPPRHLLRGILRKLPKPYRL